jgi:pantetheine-phosphate adenylyltransferase
MDKIAVFPGSFDPFTLGHEAIIKRAVSLFDKIIIGIGYNSTKKGFLPHDLRVKMIEQCFENETKVIVKSYTGLTVDFCTKENASYLLRGLRDGKDFDFERSIAMMNRKLNNKIETCLLITDPEYSAINSSIIREIVKNGGNIDCFLPTSIAQEINHFIANNENI